MRTAAWMFGLALCLGGVARAASPASGRWSTPENNGVVEVSECGAGVCGAVVTSDRIKADPGLKDAYNKTIALRTRPIQGLQIFHEMTGGPEIWKGRVYNPADGGTYSGSVRLVSADRMKLTGCIVWPLCKSETWTRLK